MSTKPQVHVPDNFVKYLPSLVVAPNPDDGAHLMFYTDELRSAFAKGDYGTIRAAEKKAADDLTPNFNSIKDNGKDAFVTVTNPSNGIDYQICASEHGWIWAYTYKETTNGKENLWAQVGTYSSNGNILGLSNTKWQAEWGNLVSSTISSVVAGLLVTFIASRLAGMTFADAVSAAATEIIAEGLATEAFAAVLSTVLGGIIVGVILTILLYIVVHFLWKDYTLQVEIHNWTADDYVISDWYSDNAVVGEGKGWEQKNLPAMDKLVLMPDGTKIPAKDAISRYDRYVYQNDNTLLEGLGIAMKIVNAKDTSKGFMIKYGLWRLSHNQIGLETDLNISLQSFYSGAWAGTEIYSTKQSFDGTAITVTTDYLSGAPHDVYRCNVHIGV